MINNLMVEQLTKELLIAVGEDPEREGLKGTPGRVARAFNVLYGGYEKKAEDVLTTTFSECADYDQMIISDRIKFYSTCEHHMLPFFGYAYVAYIPRRVTQELISDNGVVGTFPGSKVVGISKLSRLVEMHARRLQIQERMTQDIANDLERIIQPKGIGIIVKAQHMCMMARGVEQQESMMTTSAMRGVFTKAKVKSEFLELIRTK